LANELKKEIPGSRRRLFIVATVLLALLLTVLIAFGVQTVIGTNAKPAEGTMVDGVRTFNITVQQWSYKPAVIKVNPGDKVRFNITSLDMWHGFAINELNVNLTIPGEKTVTKDVDISSNMSPGVYTMYCSVFCGLGHPYLKGKMIVGNPKLFLGIGVDRAMPYLATIGMVSVFAAAIIIERKRVR
jgi:heme/copper-type cytochrome/quinol oxidase subunit 2